MTTNTAVAVVGDAVSDKEKGEGPPLGFISNAYATKKTVAEGLLDLALLMANASQLKALLSVPSKVKEQDQFYTPTISLIGISIVLQIAVGILLLVVGTLQAKTVQMQTRVNILNNVTVALILLITVVNIFISAFGFKFTGENQS